MRIVYMKLSTQSNHLCIPETICFQKPVKRKHLAFILAALLIAMIGMVFPGAYPCEGSPADLSQPKLKSYIIKRLHPETADAGPSAVFPPVYFRDILSTFYEKRNYNPLWSQDNGLTPQADQLIRTVENAELDGLTSEDYHLDQLKSLNADCQKALTQKQAVDPGKQADLDVLLTDAFLLFSSHLLSGRVTPNAVDSTWLFFDPVSDIAEILNSDVYSTQIESFFDGLRPGNTAYYRLRDALQHYIGIQKQGGWASIPSGSSLRVGDTNERVDLIRKRLIVTADIGPPARHIKPTEFDESLMKGVQHFQNRHGIEPDGVVGLSTLTAMNVPVEDRIRQIELNLERWRWIPHDLGSRYILVNIADYSLVVVENQTTVLDMRVVVGKTYRRTPVFSEKLKYLVLNPYWNVPFKIAVEDKLPIIRKNPLYLTQQHIKVFENWSENAPEINPVVIDWYRVNAGNFPYRLRQDPGPLNALGRIKFMFPNKFSIYLHDTPQRGLFKRATRDFSSGCIRIEKPVELAKYLLQNDPQWPSQRITNTIEHGVTTVVYIKDPIPVHLLYWTAWVTESGIVHFGNDIYDRDPPLSRALKAKLKDTIISAENLPGLRAEK
jgi:murein L,D-transpeptidase YcbB/YkuD